MLWLFCVLGVECSGYSVTGVCMLWIFCVLAFECSGYSVFWRLNALDFLWLGFECSGYSADRGYFGIFVDGTPEGGVQCFEVTLCDNYEVIWRDTDFNCHPVTLTGGDIRRHWSLALLRTGMR